MASEGKPTAGKRRSVWREVKQTDRKNPTFIRQLFYDTVMEDFGGDFREAAAALSPKISKGRRRAYQYALTAHTLYRIARDEVMINYAHLEMLARYHEVPTGLMLLFTRLQTEVADRPGGGLDQARATLVALDEALPVIREALERRARTRGPTLVRAVLKEAANNYQGSLPDKPGRQLRLGIPLSRKTRQ